MMETVIALLCLISVLLLWLLFQASGIRAALKRIEQQQSMRAESPETAAMKASSSNDFESQQSAFEQFLAEDPARIAMSKTDQFAAYREWRKEKGMNWSP